MINYATQELKIKLHPDLEQYYNKERYRLSVCCWAYGCGKLADKLYELTREVWFMMIEREYNATTN